MNRQLASEVQSGQMRTLLIDGVPDPEALKRYYRQAVARQEFEAAYETLDALQRQFPADLNIQSLTIALLLEQERYTDAIQEIEALISSGNLDDGLLDAALTVRSKIGPMAIHSDVQERSSISLCMIVKDEQPGLGACLNVAKKIADELIVVDTGSQDRTRDIASIFGAKTFSQAWEDDFSVARNYAISKAAGDWILILDADEIIASRDHEPFKQWLAERRSEPAAFSIETRNYSYIANTFGLQPNDGNYPDHQAGLGWVPSRKVRLFPNREDIRFQYAVHERVEPALRNAGITIVDCPIPVHHYGDLNPSKKLDKAQKYFYIGLKKLQQDDTNLTAVRELAVQAGELSLWDEAIDLWERLIERRPDFIEAHVNLSGAQWQLGKYSKALASAQLAAAMAPHIKEASFNIAVSQFMLGQAEIAVGVLKDLTARHPDYLVARFMLTAACTCANQLQQSQKLLKQLQGVEPDEAIQTAFEDLVKRMRDGQLLEYARCVMHLIQNLNPASAPL